MIVTKDTVSTDTLKYIRAFQISGKAYQRTFLDRVNELPVAIRKQVYLDLVDFYKKSGKSFYSVVHMSSREVPDDYKYHLPGDEYANRYLIWFSDLNILRFGSDIEGLGPVRQDKIIKAAINNVGLKEGAASELADIRSQLYSLEQMMQKSHIHADYVRDWCKSQLQQETVPQ